MKIALLGYARTGKDTVCELIKKRIPGTERLSFGDGLREVIEDLFPDLPMDPKPRDVFETVGQMIRQVDQNFWVKKLNDRYRFNVRFNHRRNYVITDVRQPNEADWCRRNGFKIVRVHSAETLRRDRAEADAQFHSVNKSETEMWMIDSDYTIVNNGTIEELEYKVDLLLKHMMEDAQ